MEHLKDTIVKENLRITAKIRQSARDFLEKQGFTEYSTPVLMPRTGEWYNTTFDIELEETPAMLADSPQLYKLMLALAGYESYYQFAHCFRVISKESEKHTRLSEFTQIDVELQNTDLRQLMELAKGMLEALCQVVGKMPHFTTMQGVECRESYGEAMKPDLRGEQGEIAVVFVEHMPLVTEENTPAHHIFALPSEKITTTEKRELVNATTESFDIIINGIEVGGGDLRIMDSDLQRQMMELFGVNIDCYQEYLEMLEQSTGNQGGGFAIGLERLVMALTGCENLHQTVAFPEFYKREHF